MIIMTREYGLITNAEHHSLTLMHYLWILVLYIKLGINRADSGYNFQIDCFVLGLNIRLALANIIISFYLVLHCLPSKHFAFTNIEKVNQTCTATCIHC